MNEELKKSLITALKGAGMDEGLVKSFEGQDEDTVKQFIKGLKPKTITPEDFVSSPAFDRYLEEKGLDDLLAKSKKAQSQFDQKTSKALNTFKKNLLGEDNANTSGGNSNSGTDNSDDNPVMSLLQSMREEIQSLKVANAQQQAQSTIAEAMKKSKLPANVQKMWANRIAMDSETSVDDQIKALETEYSTLRGGAEPETPGVGDYGFDQSRRNDTGLSKTEEASLASVAKNFKQ